MESDPIPEKGKASVSKDSDVLDMRSFDTPSRLRVLTKKAEGIIRQLPLNPDDKSTIFEAIDFAIQKVTKYRDIMPRADTLMKLRNGKV